jgi:hypothetical protein
MLHSRLFKVGLVTCTIPVSPCDGLDCPFGSPAAPVYALNPCSLLDHIPTKRLPIEMIEKWIEARLRLAPEILSYAAAAGHLGIAKRYERGRWRNYRAENSHQPTRRRERTMQGFKSVGSAQSFLSVHAAAYILSTSSAISPQQERTEPSGHRQC